jgi:hypothetical protein
VILVVEDTEADPELAGGWELILYNDEVNSRHHVGACLCDSVYVCVFARACDCVCVDGWMDRWVNGRTLGFVLLGQLVDGRWSMYWTPPSLHPDVHRSIRPAPPPITNHFIAAATTTTTTTTKQQHSADADDGVSALGRPGVRRDDDGAPLRLGRGGGVQQGGGRGVLRGAAGGGDWVRGGEGGRQGVRLGVGAYGLGGRGGVDVWRGGGGAWELGWSGGRAGQWDLAVNKPSRPECDFDGVRSRVNLIMCACALVCLVRARACALGC